MLPLFRRLLPRLLCALALRPAAAAARDVRAFASGGMFESLTSSMGATFKKLLGRKTLTREEVDVALASVHDALVDADVAQVGASVGSGNAGSSAGPMRGVDWAEEAPAHARARAPGISRKEGFLGSMGLLRFGIRKWMGMGE